MHVNDHYFIRRAAMPQVDAADYPAMVATAFNQGHAPAFDVVDPRNIRSHQYVNHARAAALPEVALLKPAIVSADGYVVDGNHRHWAAEQRGHLLPVIRLGMDFLTAVAWLESLPFVYTLTKSTPIRA